MKGDFEDSTHIANSHQMFQRLFLFLEWLKLLVGLGKLTWPKCWQCSMKPPSVAVWIVHTCIYKHTVAKLCLHTGVQSQPAAGKTSANYSLRAAFAAQCSMPFDTICLEFVEFQVSLIEVFSHYPIATTCFQQAFTQNNDSSWQFTCGRYLLFKSSKCYVGIVI